jgi:hypothetical protein
VYIFCAKLPLAGDTGISLLPMINRAAQALWPPGGKSNKPIKPQTSTHG